jgi:beta-galactosidase beta subunit
MIIDTIKNASKYFGVHPLFAKAFEFIEQTDLLNAPDWKLDIAEGIESYLFQIRTGSDSRSFCCKI